MESATITNYKYPKGIKYIIGNIFFERWAYYGFLSIFNYFMRQNIGFHSSDIIKIRKSLFILISIFAVVGGVIADSWIGKFKTIIFLSIFPIFGYSILALTSFLDSSMM